MFFTKAAPIPAMLISSRLVLMGWGTAPDSNGTTDVNSNSRIAFWNVSGATVNKVKCYFPNWKVLSTGEVDNTNSITVTASLEYPAGTFNQITFNSGATSVSIAGGVLAESDEITLSTPLPTFTQAWVRSYVVVTSGQIWQTAYTAITANGEAVDRNVGVDKTISGNIANGGTSGYGCVGIKGTAYTGTPSGKSITGLGDSIVQGVGDGNIDSIGNTGYLGRACGWDANSSTGLKIPYLNSGIASSTAAGNQVLARRLNLWTNLGIKTVICEYGVNDAAGTPQAIEYNLQYIWNQVANAGFKVAQATITPHSSGTWVAAGGVGQTPVAPVTIPAMNNFIRGTPYPLFDYIESSDTASTARDSDLWQVNLGWTNFSYTSDGLHPNVTDNANNQGGVFPLRDTAITKISTW